MQRVHYWPTMEAQDIQIVGNGTGYMVNLWEENASRKGNESNGRGLCIDGTLYNLCKPLLPRLDEDSTHL